MSWSYKQNVNEDKNLKLLYDKYFWYFNIY